MEKSNYVTGEYECFLKEVVSRLQRMSGDGVSVSVVRQQKNNGVNRLGIRMHAEDKRLSPVIYMEKLYRIWKEGGTMDGICEHLHSSFLGALSVRVSAVEKMDDYAFCRKHLGLRMVNKKENIRRVEDLVWRPYLDLMVFVTLEIDVGMDRGTIAVTRKQVAGWGVTAQQVWEDALAQSCVRDPWKLMSMKSLLGSMGQHETADMFVLTNTSQYHGACVLIYPDVLPWLADTFSGYLYFLPGSVHEWIILPSPDPLPAKMLRRMICDVNEKEVSAEEVLSDHPYVYERKMGELVII